jgi:hypothetical protein
MEKRKYGKTYIYIYIYIYQPLRESDDHAGVYGKTSLSLLPHAPQKLCATVRTSRGGVGGM